MAENIFLVLRLLELWIRYLSDKGHIHPKLLRNSTVMYLLCLLYCHGIVQNVYEISSIDKKYDWNHDYTPGQTITLLNFRKEWFKYRNSKLYFCNRNFTSSESLPIGWAFSILILRLFFDRLLSNHKTYEKFKYFRQNKNHGHHQEHDHVLS